MTKQHFGIVKIKFNKNGTCSTKCKFHRKYTWNHCIIYGPLSADNKRHKKCIDNEFTDLECKPKGEV
jgi:hypothetical protein